MDIVCWTYLLYRRCKMGFILHKFILLGLLLSHEANAVSDEFMKESNAASSKSTYSVGSKILHRYKRAKSVSVCPSECSCRATSEENSIRIVNCFGIGKTRIPVDIPADAVDVDLAYNHIETIEAGPFSELNGMKTLDLSYNKIEMIDQDAFDDQQRLEWLDLSNNRISNMTLTDFSEGARSLKVLNISSLSLRDFPRLHDDKGTFMTNLERLDVSDNYFIFLPHAAIPSSVKSIDLSCLKVEELSGSAFRGLQHLNELTIKGCGTQRSFTSVENGAFDGLPVLFHLDMSGNRLTSMPRRLPVSLEYLDLSNNRILQIKRGPCATDDSIRSYYETLGGLEQDVKGATVGSDLSRLVNLVQLNLNNNNIQTLCADDFIFMDQLQVLNLTNCRISQFHPQTFLYAQSLRVLDISNNVIKSFNLTEMPDLEELYAQRNMITTVDGLSMGKFPSLREADFSYNLYTCDCNLKEFVQFLAYNSDVIRFRYLSSGTTRYTCFRPDNLQDTPLPNVDVNELVCETEAEDIPWPAVAAPVSLLAIVIFIVITLFLAKRRRGTSGCCGGGERRKKVTSNYAKYDVDSDIVIQNTSINDVAILCHDTNQQWILNTLVPKLHRKHGNGEVQGTAQIDRPLKVEVFTIGKTIKIDTLHRCIDSNRKIALIVTHEFLREESCLYILKVIQERTCEDPKDAVVIIIMDSVPWSDMPKPLQTLLVEKTFVQFPQRDRERQEFYFWDNLSSLISKSEPISTRNWQNSCGDDEIVTSVRYQGRYDDERHHETDVNRDSSTIRSSRRAGTQHDSHNNEHISSARAARLQRLGIKSNGDVVDGVLAGIAEAKNLAAKRKRDAEVVSNPAFDGGLISQPSTFQQPTSSYVPVTPTPLPKKAHTLPGRHPDHPDDKLQRDIDDLYSTRKDMYRSGSGANGRVHSLLPPNCDDVDSIYSDDGERPMPGYEVRPPERDRSAISGRSKHSRRRNERSHHRGHAERSPDDADNLESIDDDRIIENLHGTAVAAPEIPPKDGEQNESEGENENGGEEMKEKTKNKKKTNKSKTLNRLRSFF